MANTHDGVTDAVGGLMKAAWDASAAGITGGTPRLIYEWVNRSGTGDPEASSSEAFARVTVRHDVGGQASVSGRLYRYGGTVFVQGFVPYVDGTAPPRAIALGKLVVDALKGKRSGSLTFRQVRLIEKGQDKSWYRVDVQARFDWYERS